MLLQHVTHWFGWLNSRVAILNTHEVVFKACLKGKHWLVKCHLFILLRILLQLNSASSSRLLVIQESLIITWKTDHLDQQCLGNTVKLYSDVQTFSCETTKGLIS